MKSLQRIKTLPWLPTSLSFLGVLLYIAQAWNFLHSQMSIDDEGNYIYKGLLFVRGQYQIFQDFGPWSNHMPLSFLIPGAVLNWFGPSLQTARLLAFTLNLALLLAIWIVARRWGGGWWATFAVWTMALNPAIIKIYSLMTSQVLIACMLGWVLVLVLAEKRALWQILLGAALAGAMLLTRLNLAPLLPLLLLYIYWQHGKRPALWATGMMTLVVIVGHAVFWPGILRMWAAWIPAGLAPFLAPYRAPNGIPFWNPQVDLSGRLISLFWGLRYHFVASVGVLATLLLWPRKSAWERSSQRRASLFLSSLFVVLLLMHAYVTVGAGIASNKAYSTNYCIFCFPTYMGFFSFTGILLIVIATPYWRKSLTHSYQVAISFLILGITTGLGYASFETFGKALADWQFPIFAHRWLRPNTLRMWKYLNYYYAISYAQTKRLAPTVIGLASGVATLLVSGGITVWLRRKKPALGISFGYITLILLLGAGWFLAPTRVLGGGYQSYDCEEDVWAAYAELGEALQALIPTGATIYWQGEPSATALVYLPGRQIFPAQINQKFTFFEGESEALERYGFWNEQLARRWLAEADYAVVGTLYYNEVPAEDLDPIIQETDFYNVDWLVAGLSAENGYKLLDEIELAMPCQPNQTIRVFQRQP